MSERWIRDDGWEITVEQREPLVTSRIPMTNLTLSGGIVNYEMFVEAALASGYVLVTTPEVPATNDPTPWIGPGEIRHSNESHFDPDSGDGQYCRFAPRPEFDAEVPASPEATSDEGTLRERLQTELDRHEYDGDNLCVCGSPWDVDGSSDGFTWTIATNRHFAEVTVATLSTELQKAQAEVIDWIEQYDDSSRDVSLMAREHFVGGAS